MVDIRPATPRDADVIGEIHVEGWQSSYAGLLPPAYLAGLDVAERVVAWRERLAGDPDRGVWCLVAEQAGEVVGFLAASAAREADVTPGTAEIRALYLREAHKGTGVGAALLRAALQRLTETGSDWVTLNVLEGNTTARSFYERFGFALDGGRFAAFFGGRDVSLVRYAAPLPV